MERYMNSSSTTVAILLLLFLVVLVFSAIMFFAENYGVFMVLFGLFILYISCNEKTTWNTMTIKEFLGYVGGSLLMAIGGVFIILNGITFQSFINLFI